MCYDARTQLIRQIKDAIHLGDYYEAGALKIKLNTLEEQFWDSGIENYYHYVSGYAHPLMFIYTNDEPATPSLATWGLIPKACKSKNDALKIRNMTLNARSETMFSKPSFAASAESQRCVVYFEGFYEHHHHEGKTYPFLIGLKNEQMMPFAGLYADWQDPSSGEEVRTFSIVTTSANKTLSQIHNNPKAKFGARMPVILHGENISTWLNPAPAYSNNARAALIALCQPYPDEKLIAYTVGRLKGKQAIGNVPKVVNKVKYEELELR